jgi:hypothetical protein
MTDLSPLALAYLEHLDVIEAGWAALRADVPAALEGIARRARAQGEAVVAHADHIERRWEDRADALHLGFSLTLRLHWEVAAPLAPWLSLNHAPEGYRELPRALRQLFPEPLWEQWAAPLSPPSPAALLRGPAEALWAAWEGACAQVDALSRRPEIRRRLTAFALLSEISNQLYARLDGLAEAHASPAQRPGEVGNEEGWPAYVQVDWALGERVQHWSLTYCPAQGEDSPGELLLVLYDGAALSVALPVARAERYQGRFPVLADWGESLQALDALGDGPARREALLQTAQRLAGAWVALVQQLTARLAGG